MIEAKMRPRLIGVALGLLMGALAALPAWGTTISITPSSTDTFLDQDFPGAKRGGNATFNVKSFTGGKNARGVVSFNLSAIPSGSLITSAILELYMTTAPGATRTHDVHRMTRAWVESQATWNEAATGVAWTTAGGDYAATPTTSVTTGTVSGVWLSWNITADVDAWYRGLAPNYGVLIKDAAEASTTSYTAVFASKENATTANRPRLVVTYTPPDLQITGMTVDASAFNGDTVTVTMTVANQGPLALTNVTPSALITGGTATKTLLSGPTPASVASLASGASTSFTWIYTVSGTSGQTYNFTGSASADGPITSSSATTNTGSIAAYSISVSPTSVTAGGTNVQVAFTVDNGPTAGTIDRVTVNNPNTTIWAFNSTTWGNNDTSGWNKATAGCCGHRFLSPNAASDIQPGTGKTFTVTFTTIGNPGADTTYTFPVDVRRAGGGTTTQNVTVTVRVPALQVQSITVDSSVVSGDNVTVTMTVKNTGSVSLSSVTPSALTTGGTAAKALLTGPTPPSVASLAADTTTTFTWVYRITGTTGQTYSFTGNATANGGSVTAGSATSNTGSIVAYGLTVTPTSVNVGATGVQMQFVVTNNLTAGTVDQVTVTNPNTTIFASDGTWGNNDGSGWTRSQPAANQYRFASPAAANDIAANGGTKTFTVTFTTIGDTGLDTASYSFSVAIRRRGAGTTTLTETITVTKYVLTLQSVVPASIPADGQTTSRVIVRLTLGGVAQANQTITFTTTAGAFGGATSTTATTNVSGDAFVDLTASASATDVTATVSASFSSVASVSTSVSFLGITFALSPATATVDADGQSTAALTLTFRYTTSGAAVSGAIATVSLSGSGSVSPASPASSASPIAVTYTAPAAATDGTATVTATYRGLTATSSTITYRGLTLSLTPATATVDADGLSTTALTLTFRYTTGGAAISGATATVAVAGLGSVSPTSAASSAGGIAVTYRAPASSADGTATVTAAYRSLTATSSITYRGITLSLSPASATVDGDGQSTAALTLTARYTTAGTALPAATTLAVSPGTIGSVAPTSATAASTAVTFTAAALSSTTSGTVTATYRGLTATTAITVRGVTLSLSASPTSIPADGTSTSAITATLSIGGSGSSGASIAFSTSSSTVSPTPVTTDASGNAATTLTSISSGTDVTATITATYRGVTQTTTVTFSALTLSLTVSPASIPADGVTTATLTATLTTGAGGLSDHTVTFSTTSGTLSAASAVTNAAGQATVTIKGAASKSGTTASITAAFAPLTSVTSVTFTGITISEVAELNVTAGNAATTAYWAWPTATGYRDGVVILRRAAVTPAVPADGLAVTVGDILADGSRVVGKVAVGGGSSVADPGLTNGTKYFYRAVGYYAGSLYSTAGVGVDATPTAGGAGQPLWSMSSSSAATSELIWDGGTGLVWGSAAGFTTVDSVAGTQPWSSMMTGAAVRTPPTLTVIDVLLDWFYVIGADDGRVSVTNGVTGAVLWQTASPLGDAITAAPAVQYRVDSNAAFQAVHTTDAVFVATKNASPTTNKVYALDALTGAVKWTFNAGGTTAVDQATGYLWADATTNRLWVVTKSNAGTQPSVWVLSTVDGTLQASFSLGDVAAVGWSWDANHLYVSTSDGNFQAINTATMALVWSSPLAVGSPVVGYVLEAFDLKGKIFFSTQSGTVRGAQLNGAGLPPTVLWTTPLAGATNPFVVGAQGVLYVGGADGKVHKLSLTDGVDVAQVTAGDGTQAITSLTVDTTGGTVWATTLGGKLYALPLP